MIKVCSKCGVNYESGVVEATICAHEWVEGTYDDGPELDVSSVLFTVKDPDGNILLETINMKQAFDTKQFNPGSTVHVTATVDATIEVSEKLISDDTL